MNAKHALTLLALVITWCRATPAEPVEVFKLSECRSTQTTEERDRTYRSGCAMWSNGAVINTNPARVCISPTYTTARETKHVVTCERDEWR